jgi:hypothetical protein
VITLTIADLRRHDACYLDKRIADLRRVLPDVADDEPVPLATWWALPSTSTQDRWWSLRAAKPALDARRLGVRAACRAARRVLPLVREQDRAVCLAAIEAGETWAAEPTDQRAANAYAADAAAAIAAASDAAYAACAAYAAARAARAAAYADADAYADAYADAAYAAAYAAANAANAAAAERQAQRADLDDLVRQ